MIVCIYLCIYEYLQSIYSLSSEWIHSLKSLYKQIIIDLSLNKSFCFKISFRLPKPFDIAPTPKRIGYIEAKHKFVP